MVTFLNQVSSKGNYVENKNFEYTNSIQQFFAEWCDGWSTGWRLRAPMA